MSDIKLGGLFYPSESNGKKIPFDSLYIPYIYKEIYLEGIYTDIFTNRKDLVVIDVGANIGVVTQYMRNFSKVVYAIEPSPEHFKALKENVKFNKWDNVKTFEFALSNKNGKATLNQFEANRTSHSIAIEHGGDKVEVITKRFDTFLKENNIKEDIDFVKFDVEGAEDMILRSKGFKKIAKQIKAIEIEFHFPSYPDLVQHMMGFGFEARRYDASAVIVLFTRKEK